MNESPKLYFPRTFWLTGLSGSGKSTLALAFAEALDQASLRNRVLDGDVLRRNTTTRLGFSRLDRRANIEYAAQQCRQANRDGFYAIAAFISPYRDDREMARNLIGAEVFNEIHVSTPLEICEMRDPKGLYRRARAGEITQFTGIDDPYEPPMQPNLVLNTAELPVADCISRMLNLLEP